MRSGIPTPIPKNQWTRCELLPSGPCDPPQPPASCHHQPAQPALARMWARAETWDLRNATQLSKMHIRHMAASQTHQRFRQNPERPQFSTHQPLPHPSHSPKTNAHPPLPLQEKVYSLSHGLNLRTTGYRTTQTPPPHMTQNLSHRIPTHPATDSPTDIQSPINSPGLRPRACSDPV